MANVTGTFTTQFATVTVTITDSGAAQTFEMFELGDIVYEFDLVPDAPTVNRIVAMYNTTTIKAWQYDNSGNDLFDRFSTGAARSVLYDVAFHDGTTAQFRFELPAQGVAIDERKRELTLKLQPYRLPTTMGQYFANSSYANDFTTFGRSRADATFVQYPAVTPGRFIQRILQEMTPAQTPNVVSGEYVNIGFNATPELFDNLDKFEINAFVSSLCFGLVNVSNALGFPNVVLANGAEVFPENVPAFDVMVQLAFAEGAIVGAGFDSFYQPRVNWINGTPIQPAINLSYADMVDLKFTQNFNAYRRINTNITTPAYVSTGSNRRLPVLPNSPTFTANGDTNANKEVLFEFKPAFPHLSVGLITNNAVFPQTGINGDSPIITAINTTTVLAIAGLGNYERVFLQPDNSLMIEGVVYGFNSIKPYNAIQFDSDAPERYVGKVFRPTYLSYSFKRNEVRFKAYQLS